MVAERVDKRKEKLTMAFSNPPQPYSGSIMAARLKLRTGKLAGRESWENRSSSLYSKSELSCYICGDSWHPVSTCELNNILFKCVLCKSYQHTLVECPLLERLERATQQQLHPSVCMEGEPGSGWNRLSVGQAEYPYPTEDTAIKMCIMGDDEWETLEERYMMGEYDEVESWEERCMVGEYDERESWKERCII